MNRDWGLLNKDSPEQELKLIKQDQELTPALQRQSKEGAETYSWPCWVMGTMNRTSLKWPLFQFEGKLDLERKIQKLSKIYVKL